MIRTGIVAGGAAGTAVASLAASARLPARPADILAASVVAAALAVTAYSWQVAGVGAAAPWTEADAVRLSIAAAWLAASLPWLAADLGLYVADIPMLGAPFLSRDPFPPGSSRPAVHLGHHHGLDGVLLALTALVLSRTLPSLRPAPVREALSLYLAGMLVYGMVRAAEDFWFEQIVKRGWTTVKIPRVVERGRPVRPELWAAILAAGVVVHRRWFDRPGRGYCRRSGDVRCR